MEIFNFPLAWRRLKTIKLKKKIFLPTSDKSEKKKNPYMQLRSVLTGNRYKLKVLILKVSESLS